MRIRQIMKKPPVVTVLILLLVLMLVVGIYVSFAVYFYNSCLLFSGLGERPEPADVVLRHSSPHWSTPQWTLDGARVVFTTYKRREPRETSRIYVAASDGSSLLSASLDEYQTDHSPSISPDGSRIAYVKHRDIESDRATGRPAGHVEIWTVRLDGSDRRRLSNISVDDGIDLSPVWSPDGSRIAFVRNAHRRCGFYAHEGIYTANVDSDEGWVGIRKVVSWLSGDSGIRKVVDLERANLRSLTWSPDGRYFAFIINEFQPDGVLTSLVTVNVDGSDWTRLVTEPEGTILVTIDPSSFPSSLAWSPGGDRIAFMRRDAGKVKLYTIGRDGIDLREVAEPTDSSADVSVGGVSWSSAGDQIRFSLGKALYVVNADGSRLRRVGEELDIVHGVLDSIRSPDGSMIANLVPKLYGVLALLFITSLDGSDARVIVRMGRDGVLEAVGPEQRPSAIAASCSAGVVVPNPAANSGLVRDCEALVKMIRRLSVVGLNWNADTAIADWVGVSLGDVSPHSRVRGLSLSGYGMIGVFPDAVTQLTELRSLDLSGNYLSGSIPSGLGDIKNLKSLYLQSNSLIGPIPSELGNLLELQELDLSDNNLAGPIPWKELGGLPSLRILRLSSIGLTGSIPSELGNFANLEVLNLWDNNLTGSILSELGNLANLEVLNLRRNTLTGSIPPELGNLANLEVLNLRRNTLTGSIPSELGNLANLEVLNLSNNTLTGSIPSELGNLANLEVLNLSDNTLTGSIPPELGNLANLEVLDLGGVRGLSGCMPLLQASVIGRRHLPPSCGQ